ncbi:hypothetical protein BUALT_Bualt07G0024100 [Buddleja alternifolia]|uniref:Uncharacterized protein n=1 Tax=Buddleja alternifolia TaxID=168488 RepID=A0AAV6XBL8_9LAMI|nr:hypothetical protein BUALT_Bualt07G0024100 [Buddleja alternifolia]
MKQITEVANEAEEIIDSHVVDRLRQEHGDKTNGMGLSLLFSEDINIGADVVDELCEGSESPTDMGLISSTSFCQDIDKVIEKIDSIKEELLLTMVKAEGKAVQEQQPPRVSVRAGSSTLLPSRGNNTHVVGFDEHLMKIKVGIYFVRKLLGKKVALLNWRNTERKLQKVAGDFLWQLRSRYLFFPNDCFSAFPKQVEFELSPPNGLEMYDCHWLVVKLRSGPFFESEWHEWNPVEGEFLRLKFLSIGSTNLRRWNAEDIHFPCLETLVLSRIHDLQEIPSGIGEIGTLRLIYLHACGDTVMDSAIQIIEEQRSMGNDDHLRLHANNLAMETIF